MKLTPADITPTRVKFNSHKVHNPDYDIIQLTISADAFITYCLNIDTKEESMEYYAGSNYVVGSMMKSHSRHYPKESIPKKYRHIWNGLKEYYNTKILSVS